MDEEDSNMALSLEQDHSSLREIVNSVRIQQLRLASPTMKGNSHTGAAENQEYSQARGKGGDPRKFEFALLLFFSVLIVCFCILYWLAGVWLLYVCGGGRGEHHPCD